MLLSMGKYLLHPSVGADWENASTFYFKFSSEHCCKNNPVKVTFLRVFLMEK